MLGRSALVGIAGLLLCDSTLVQSAPVAPPRSISDVAAVLDQEKPDPGRIESQNAKANAAAPQTAEKAQLAKFYLDRAEMRGRLGRVREAIADADQSCANAEGNKPLNGRCLLLLGQLYGWRGDTQKSLDAFRRAQAFFPNDRQYNIRRWIGIDLIALGNLDEAERYMKLNRDALDEAAKDQNWQSNPFKVTAEAHVAFGNAAILEARGQFHESARAYELAEQKFRESLTQISQTSNSVIKSSVEQVCDWMVARAGRVQARDGRLVEAEVDVRRALLGWLKLSGKYDLNTARIVDVFTLVLVEQGRYADAEVMARQVLDIYDALGTERDSQVTAIGLNRLAGILALQNKWSDASKVYSDLDEATKSWEESRKDEIGLDMTRVLTAYNSGRVEKGIEAAQRLVTRQTARFGDRHIETALAQGTLGIGLALQKKNDEATKEFARAAPVLVESSRSTSDESDDAVSVAMREQRVRKIIEAYMTLLASKGPTSSEETFLLAEVVRGRSVQKALAASSTRILAGSPDLAAALRDEQDLGKQIGSQLGSLNNLLAMPPAQRDEKLVRAIEKNLEALRKRQRTAKAELEKRFPEYAELVSPRAPTFDAVRSSLHPNEALLSFYFGESRAFVWAVPKSGAFASATVEISGKDIDAKISKLRESLEPQAAMISDIPPFDVKLAHDIFARLLNPVKNGWGKANSLIVVTNGALGLLPLSVLPTEDSEISANDDPLFASYRNVKWLARTHAVTSMPSAAALRTLRRLPPGKPSRDQLIAFGDPFFSKAQQAETNIKVADTSNTTRGAPLKRRNSPKLDGVDSAELAMLPRLPDTADELTSIAQALKADPAKSVFLGDSASEDNVKATDLSHFKVLAFATHGLVPGELNGLTQPALALSSPEVTGGQGDGLLTMDEILALKLDADWVLLSACNTAAGAGAGAEAASGLGRAFFYAGTRALLVTNWSVHSQSARELVTDLFKRQANDPKLSRSDALRQAMMALADGPGFVGSDGKSQFLYAHPLFWAPYSIIGDGG